MRRLEDPNTGRLIEDLQVPISDYYQEEAKQIAGLVGDGLYTPMHLLDGVHPISQDNLPEMYLNGNWRPSLTITGVDGIPPTAKAGNVIRASTTVKVSIRLPPTLDANKARAIIEPLLTTDVPYGAHVQL